MLSFKGRHFVKPIILMTVRWYVAYSLSYRNIEELLQDRGLEIDHSTINRWVIEYAPRMLANFKSKKKAVNNSWLMDESVLQQAA
jgi:putative transposase